MPDDMMLNEHEVLDPLGDADTNVVKNRAKVGTARPSSLLYTYGPGSIMDLPNFSVMPAGLGDWDRIWSRREVVPTIIEPRLLKMVQLHLGYQVESLRPFPWQPKRRGLSTEGSDLGVPARIFPQWLRCTGCDYLGPLPRFDYSNTHPFRPDLAQFVHKNCPGRGGRNSKGAKKGSGKPAVPAPHLLTCTNGHLDEFPYALWVHRGHPCEKAEMPDLKMLDTNVGKSIGSTIRCAICGKSRGMAEAQGRVGREKLPQVCRGRHPHLNGFDKECNAQPVLIMMGASNLWFPSLQSVIVMPRTEAEETDVLAQRLREALGLEKLGKYGNDLETLRDVIGDKVAISTTSDDELAAAVTVALAPVGSEEARLEAQNTWDPVDLLVPEWRYLQQPALFPQQQALGGLMVTEMPRHRNLHPRIDRVVAVNKMKKVNAVLGFTRLDVMDRVNDLDARLVKLTADRPTWMPATEDRGEGVFLQLDLDHVAAWEAVVESSQLWTAHTWAHRRNFERRFSETAKKVRPDERLPPPRYWLLHSLSHALIREMAMSSGYGAASLSERIYGWKAKGQREASAGVLICTTASDSEGTLGGLVALADPGKLHGLLVQALRRASRCSSDPVCAMRTPSEPEDFLHGAACHCCSFASETSCETANRFLDRRLLLSLPSAMGLTVQGFFGGADAL